MGSAGATGLAVAAGFASAAGLTADFAGGAVLPALPTFADFVPFGGTPVLADVPALESAVGLLGLAALGDGTNEAPTAVVVASDLTGASTSVVAVGAARRTIATAVAASAPAAAAISDAT